MDDFPDEFRKCDIATACKLRSLGLTIYSLDEYGDTFTIYFSDGDSFFCPRIGESSFSSGNGMSGYFNLYFNIDDLV